MTREEAKHRLLSIERCTPIHTREDARDFEALEMAIQALSQEPKQTDIEQKAQEYEKAFMDGFESCSDLFTRNKEQQPCDDAVSRKKAIWVISACDGKSEQIEALEQLPSVTQKSETVTEFADRCRECGAKYGKLLKQKSGKWLYKEITDDYRVTGQCSECKERRIIDNYCPNCGACMKDGRTLDEFIEDSKESEEK